MGGLTVVIQDAPYVPGNKAWHGLRLAGAALAEGLDTRVFLLERGVELAATGHTVPEGKVDLEALLSELVECGLEVQACGMCMDTCRVDDSELVEGVTKGSMKSLVGWARDSDQVVAL